ncbi:MAG: cytidine deaminase [Oscillospiraceae bacterium]|nr:cytidine deaminase [Oscillospiraceae bacterium]
MLNNKKYNGEQISNRQIKELYDVAKSVAIPKVISDQMCSGGVGAAVLAKSGKIYTGVCIDTDCSLGMCAERNALSTMITNGDCDAQMVIAVTKLGQVIPPCGACREFMMQLGNSEHIKVIIDNNGTAVNLEDLMPYPY